MNRLAARCLTTAALLPGLLAVPALAEPPAAAAAPSPLRQAVVDRAERALTTSHAYRETRNGPRKWSTPGDARHDNYLGGADRNEYNGFNGDYWCGYFAAAMWNNRRATPDNYKSSRAWETGVGDRFYAYRPGRPPQRGDVIVWHNHNRRDPEGHVAVVVAVGGSGGRTVVTIEGNAGRGSDSITRREYRWAGTDGPRIPTNPGLKLRGFASRS
ncbi:CHAP domain-containing protein [Streptomyces sp. NPDC059785]|uniref:CHAP domain-containing protein n=1 Tax=Streptomyces sp. NPDC059785 TaxID=3346945 RepID=UPI003652ADF2